MQPDKPKPPPNIVWISTHDINPHLGCYAGVWPGAEQASTPHLDRLAAEGLRFDQAFSTAPVCGPSRSSVVTGCFPPAIGTMHMRTSAVPPAAVHLLPEYFRAAGYWTGNSVFTDYQMEVPAPVYDRVADDVHWRDRPDPDQPFFIARHGLITHESSIFADPERYAKLTERLTPDQRVDPDKAPVPPYHPDTETFRASWARYLELIAALDHTVGDLLADLDEDGLADNTIVVFWSDHGVGLPGGKRWAAEAGYREPLLIRWPGAIAPGTVCERPVSLMDLAPTMLAMCGLEVPEHMHGQVVIGPDGLVSEHLRPYVVSARDRMGESEDTSRSVRDARFRYTRHLHPDRPAMQHSEYPDHLSAWQEFRALRGRESEQQLSRGQVPSLLTDRQRRILATTRPVEELFDISVDPHEEHDLAGDPAYAEDLARLSAALDEWTARVGDLGVEDEIALLKQWRPGGREREVPAPTVEVTDGSVTVTSALDGVVLGWTDVPAEAGVTPPNRPPFFGYRDDARSWRLVTGPFTPDAGPVWVKAWRIGYAASPEVVVQSD